MSEIATKTTWENHAINNPKQIEIALQFTEGQFSKLTKGLIPQQMEDKWFIFYENDWLYFHRSWTGLGIYKAQLLKEQDGYAIKEFWAERNQEKYSSEDDRTDIENFSFLIARGLLGIDVSQIYSYRNIKSKDDVINGWSNFGNMLFTNNGVDYSDKIKAALFGVAIGDAVGVPYEFSSREKMINDPATNMIGFGTYNQPPGTWSDDSSLTFCLAESLATEGIDLANIASTFCKWKNSAYWTARNEVFDIGNTTYSAIHRLSEILDNGNLEEIRNQKNYGTELENGNGSLMRIIPLLFYIAGKPIKEQFEITWAVSALTHRHIRAAMSCLIYLKLAEKILNGIDKERSYTIMRKEITDFWNEIDFPPEERLHFRRLIQADIRNTGIDDLKSGGYVIEVLESSIWFFLNKNTYKETVLSIINLGHDTDTSAAIAGGLAGLYYGYDGIPEEWLNQIARKSDIENLAELLENKIARY